MEGVKNFLQLIIENWTLIIAFIGVIIGVLSELKKYMNKSTEERIEIAKKQIQETILSWITDSELQYSEWSKAGSIKRSEVIKKIFEKYPILSKVANQDEVIAWIDEIIDKALEELKSILKTNGNMMPITFLDNDD